MAKKKSSIGRKTPDSKRKQACFRPTISCWIVGLERETRIWSSVTDLGSGKESFWEQAAQEGGEQSTSNFLCSPENPSASTWEPAVSAFFWVKDLWWEAPAQDSCQVVANPTLSNLAGLWGLEWPRSPALLVSATPQHCCSQRASRLRNPSHWFQCWFLQDN